MVDYILVRIFGLVPIWVGIIFEWRSGEFGLCFFMFGVLVYLAHENWRHEKDRKSLQSARM